MISKVLGLRAGKALLLFFKNIEAIKNASVEELSGVDGMNSAAAGKRYMNFSINNL